MEKEDRERLIRIESRVETMEEKADRFTHEIHGNGRPGIKAELISVKTTLRNGFVFLTLAQPLVTAVVVDFLVK